jgi:hypothetical protein
MHFILRSVAAYLQKKPIVGFVCGMCSGLILRIQNLLTDEATLKMVAGVASWSAALISVLTVIVWVIKVYDIIKPRLKLKK